MSQDLTQRVQNTALTPASQNMNSLKDLLEKNKMAISQAIPKHMNADRLSRVALTLVRTTPALLECSPQSIMGGVLMSAQLGLELGMIGHAYLVPFNNKKTGRKEAQFIIGYRGMIDLARRSGNIESIKAEPVYVNDFFKLTYGLDDKLDHVPWHCREDQTQTESGAFRGAYAIAKFVQGGHAILYMPKAEIDQHRARSKSGQSGPWVSDYVQMALKTVVRGLWKWLPISIEVARQVESNDGTAKTEINTDMSEALDVSGENQDMFADAETVQPEPTPIRPAADPFVGCDPKYVLKAKKQLGLGLDSRKLTIDEINKIIAVAEEIEQGDI